MAKNRNSSRRRRNRHTSKGNNKPTLVLPSSQTKPSSLSHRVSQQIHKWLMIYTAYFNRLIVWEHRSAKILRKFLKELIFSTISLILFTLFGLNSPANSSPILIIASHNWIVSASFSVFLALYIVRVFRVSGKTVRKRNNSQINQHRSKFFQPLSFVRVLPYIFSLLLISTLIPAYTRPAWCPTILCPAPQLISILPLHAEDVYDDKLEMYFKAIQSTSYYVIPGDPAHYSLNNLPKASTVVLPADGHNSTLLYHLILGLQNLQQGHYGMTIEQINLVVEHVSPAPQTLNVWKYTSPINYSTNNQYQAFYAGQLTNAILLTDLSFKGFVRLSPRETDSIDIHIVSRLEKTIQFSVQVMYRVDYEFQEHWLRLPLLFEVIFANPSKWHLYHLQDGHFMLNS